jgi:hypothetical protein
VADAADGGFVLAQAASTSAQAAASPPAAAAGQGGDEWCGAWNPMALPFA